MHIHYLTNTMRGRDCRLGDGETLMEESFGLCYIYHMFQLNFAQLFLFQDGNGGNIFVDIHPGSNFVPPGHRQDCSPRHKTHILSITR